MQSVGQVKTQLAKGLKCVGEAHEQALRFLVRECLRTFSGQEDFIDAAIVQKTCKSRHTHAELHDAVECTVMTTVERIHTCLPTKCCFCEIM